MTRPMFRVNSNKLPPNAYTTFQAFRTDDSWELKECREAECGGYTNGWTTKIDTSTDLGKQQADYIRRHSGRDFTEMEEHGFIVFIFAPGQKCFKGTHKVLNDRPAVFVQRGGDWRQNLGLTRQFGNADEFVDAFASHQNILKDALERG